MEFKDLITEEPAMDNVVEMQRINKERTEQEIINDLKELARVEGELVSDGTAQGFIEQYRVTSNLNLDDVLVDGEDVEGDAHLQVEIPTAVLRTPVVEDSTQVFQDVKDISVDNTKELAETVPLNTTIQMSDELKHISESTMSAPKLQGAAALIKFHCSLWNNHRRDTKAARQVKDINGLKNAGVEVSKKLLPNCKSLQRIYTLGGQGRTAHYKDSYPWSKDGGRVMPNEDVIEYIKKFSGIKNEFDKEVIKFIDHDYDNAVIDEQARLQGDNDTLFNRSDYPDKEELRKLFSLSIEVEQLHSDWRTDIEDEGHEVVSDFYRDQHKERMKKFTDEVLKDTVTHITKLAESLDYRGESTTTNPDYKSWQASAFEHVERMITVLDRFNLDGNSAMQVARNKLHAQISGRGITAGMLKSSESLRVETKQTIDEVLAALPSLNQ